jgi:hypothetical protein
MAQRQCRPPVPGASTVGVHEGLLRRGMGVPQPLTMATA